MCCIKYYAFQFLNFGVLRNEEHLSSYYRFLQVVIWQKIFCDQYCVDLVVSGMGSQEDSQYDHSGNSVKKASM